MTNAAEELQALHLIDIKFISPTNLHGARVKISDIRFDESVTIPYDYAFNQALDVALDWIKNNTTLKPYAYGTTKDNYFIVIKPVDHQFKSLKSARKEKTGK